MTTTSSLPAITAPSSSPTSLYDHAVAILRERYFDKEFRETKLEALAQQCRSNPQTGSSLQAERDALTRLLSHLPATHLGVLSEESFNYLIAELSGEMRPTFGLQALRIKNDYYTFFVLEGGPAQEAGILPWERIVAIDGKPTAESPRLDYQQKDAHLPIDRDPPVHSILAADDDEISLVLERTPAEQRTLRLRARPYSALAAARASVHAIEREGRKLGYIHFWFIHSTGVLELLQEAFSGVLANVDGLVLDLRGRGGNGVIVQPLLQRLTDWGRPIVALTDRQSRSAKDALAYEFKQRHLATVVGERTAGAVIPASFASLGRKTILMFPSFTLGEYTEKLELKGGVEPDVFVERAGPYANGKDPILEGGLQELVRLTSADTPKLRPENKLAAAPGPGAVSPQALPTVEALILKMVAALGSEKTLRAQAHRTLTGTTEMIGLPMKGAFVQKASAPNKSLVAMNLGDLRVRQGFDGTTAWTETSMNGLQILSGPMADAIRQQAQFYGPLDLLAVNKEVVPAGYVSFDNKTCVELKLVGPSGGVSFLYIDSSNWLIAGTKVTVETPMGKIESKTFLRDYKDLGGFMTATEIVIESSVQRQAIHIEKVNFDPIPPEEFAVPKGSL